MAVSYVVAKRDKDSRKSLRTRIEAIAIEKGKAAYLEIYANLQHGKTYFSITTEEVMEAIQQQMVEAKKSERANALNEVKRLGEEFGFTAGMLKGSLAEGRRAREK